MSRGAILMMTGLLMSWAMAQDQPVLTNGDFEQFVDAPQGMNNWTLGDPPQRPEGWSLNNSYPGELEIRTDDPHSGERYLRINAPERGTHLFQIRDDFDVEQWYRISVWIRGGPVVLHTYDYFEGKPMRVPTIAQGKAPADQWRQIAGYYRPGGEAYRNSGPAIAVASGASADIDLIVMEPIDLPRGTDTGPDITLENELIRVTISSAGLLTGLVCKQTGEDYAFADTPFPVFAASRDGTSVPIHSITAEGDLLRIQFLDPEVQATVRVTEAPTHLLFEVIDAQPEDLSSFEIELPVRQLATVAGAFNATYDDRFGMCLFGTTINAYNAQTARLPGCRGLRSRCVAEHDIVGAGFALVAAPRADFNDAIMAAERATGLPCPVFDGQWLRVSDFARESYLFATSVHENDIDTLIDYAKLGGFGTLIILKNSWLANHGHFDVNLDSFPEGRAGLKRAVDRIHAAGLHAGVHVFGPSISSNDPYVTPVPDDRLASVPCPPLAEAVDAEAGVLTLTAQPELLPPTGARSRAFPGHYLRIGDEIVAYADADEGPPFRFVGCRRGALGTTAAAHDAGAEVKGLLTQWGFLLVQPDSSLADELVENFADVFNYCGFDMAYFDASDGLLGGYGIDRWYYLNKMHLGYWNAIGRDDVLYQTSNGTGSNICWHIIPRSASADGHGDIKGYLDGRWRGIMGQAANYTRSDIGWYYMFKNVRPDQIEYVRAKALGLGGSVSVEASRASLEALPLARATFEMLSRYEQCRLADYFPQSVLDRLLEPGRDFRLLPDGDDDWQLFETVYEEPRVVDALDGEANVWRIANDRDEPCLLGVEVVRGARLVATAGYEDAGAMTIESFTDAGLYQLSETNDFEKFVKGDKKEIADNGVVRAGVTHDFELSDDARLGGQCLAYSAENAGGRNGWSGIGRRFDAPLDLTDYAGLGVWIHGDAGHEKVRVQLRDSAGRFADHIVDINFAGWSLHTFTLPTTAKFDRSQVEYLLFYFNNIPRATSVAVRFDEVKALPGMGGGAGLGQLTLTVNGADVALPVELAPGDAVTCEGPSGVTVWPPGMEPGRSLEVDTAALVLPPGESTIELTAAGEFPGDVKALLYRMWAVPPE